MDLNVVSEDDDVLITTNTKDVINIDEEIKYATNFLGVIEKITNYLQYLGDVDDVVASKTALNTLQHEGELSAPHNQKKMFLNLISQRQPFCYYSSLWKLYYQFHIKSAEKVSVSGTFKTCSEVAAASTTLVHSSSVFNDICSMLLALPAEEQLAHRSNIIRFLYELLPKVAANYHSIIFWSCFIHFLLLDNKESEACKMLILASCLGTKDAESLCVARDGLTLFSVISAKLKHLRTQSPWSGLILQREKFNQSKTLLRIDCNKSVTDDFLWKNLFELYKAELERISQEHTSQHVYRLYHAVLEHLDVESKTQLEISENEREQLGIDLLLFTLRKSLLKFSKCRNKVNHLYYFAHQMYETLKQQSNQHASSMLKFLAQFIQEHILHSSFNLNYYQDQPTWLLLSSIMHSMHGDLFDSTSRQEAIQRAKEICDLGIKQLSDAGIIPYRLVNESAMLSLKMTGQPTTSREIFGAAVEKYPDSIDLWLYYAQFERAIRQFKQAVSVYEKALSIKQVSNEPAVWRDYVQFSLQREKLGNARSIYIRSLSQVDPKFVDALWQDFLDFENNIRKKQPGDQPPSLLSLDQLKQAVIAQQPSLQISQPEVIAQPVIKQETAEPLPDQVQTENTGHADHKREATDIDSVPVKKPKIETPSPELPRLELPTSYTEQPVEALPAYVQPSAKFQRPAFRTPENRPSQHSDNLSIESPFVEALMQPVATITPEKEKPVFGAAPRTLASVSGALTMEQIKLLEDAQKLLLQRQDSQPIPQSTNETTNAPANVNAPTPMQPAAPTQQAPQMPQPANTQQLPPLLIQLSEVLQDPLIFDIVKSLQNIQMLKEKEIQKGRHELKIHQKKMRDQLLQRHRELLNQATPITYQQIHSQNTQQLRLHEQSCRDELAQYDKKASEELERQILDQQRILQQAGVPGFFPSTNKADVELHSQLLKLILSLAQELEKDQNPVTQRLNTQIQPPSIPETQPISTIPLQPAIMNPPMTLQQLSVAQPQLSQLPMQQLPQLPPHLPVQPQIPVQPQLPTITQGPLDLLAAILAPSQPTPLANVPMQPVHNVPQLSVQQITQMIGNLISNTPAQSQGELIQQIQGYLPMLPNELQTHILQTLIATLQNQQNTVFQPMQHQPDPNMLLANAMGAPLNPIMNFPPNDTIVLHGAQGPVTVPLSMLNQPLNFPQPNLNQPPPQQPRNPRQNYQKRRF